MNESDDDVNVDGDEARSKQAIDAVTAAFFRAVSFVEGEKPPYSDLYDIFIETGLIIRDSSAMPDVFSVREFIEPRQRMVDAGQLVRFAEVETGEITEIFGNVAHRFSTYRKYGISGGTEVNGRGIISFQFVMTPSGWKISSLAWDDERPRLTIPERYQ